MKKLPVGLVIEGNSTSSVLLRLPGVVSSLGPIKSSGFQVARRVSNFLRGGFAARSYAELEIARIILIRAPDRSTNRLVSEIVESGLNCSDRVFVLCETWAPTESLKPLQELGASIASLVLLPTGAEKIFAIEGDPLAVRPVRKLLDQAEVRSVELKENTKHLLYAGVTLCSVLPIPLLVLCQQALREAGFSGNQLSLVLKDMSFEMIAGFLKSARLTWGGFLVESGTNEDFYWRRLNDTHPELAKNLRDLIECVELYMGKKLSQGHGA